MHNATMRIISIRYIFARYEWSQSAEKIHDSLKPNTEIPKLCWTVSNPLREKEAGPYLALPLQTGKEHLRYIRGISI